MNSQLICLELTLNVYVHFHLFGKAKRVLVAQKTLSFYEKDMVGLMESFIRDEIDTLRNDPHLIDIWDRVEISVTKCQFHHSYK